MGNLKYSIIYLILFIYIFIQTFLTNITPNIFSKYIHPFVMLSIFIYLCIKTKNNHGRFYKEKNNIIKMFYISVLYMVIYFYTGFLLGFTNSPYSHKFTSIIKNIWQLIIPIISIEYIRSVLVNYNLKNKKGIILATILLFVIELNLATMFKSIGTREMTFKYISSEFISLFCFNLLYTYLTYKGSYKLVLTYRLIYELTIILLPILPSLDWFSTGIIGLVVPMIFYVLFKYDFKSKNRGFVRAKKSNPIAYIIIIPLVVIFASFMLGLFKYQPVAVVSNSMNPIFYRGDVVILCKVDKKSIKRIKKHDIIIYKIDKQQIVHRVIDIKIINGKKQFLTKGDANNAPDPNLVSKEQIIGTYKNSIKYIGYPSVWLSEFFKYQKPKVEIK